MRKLIFSISLLLLVGIGWAQKKNKSSANLEKQRVALLNEISKTEKQLDELAKNKTTSVTALEVLQQKLNARNKLVLNLDRAILSLDNSIGQTNNQIVVLRGDLTELKKHYAELVRFSYKNRTAQNFLLFLFSAKSFNDATRRLSYVKQYRNYRAKQAKKIELANLKLSKTAEFLTAKKVEKADARNTQRQQNLALQKETTQQNQMVEKLKGQESVLKKQLAAKQLAAVKLNNAIATAIQEEIAKAQQRAIEEQLKRQQEALEKQRKEELTALAEKRKAEATARDRERMEKAEAEAKRIAIEKAKQEAAERIAQEEERQAEEENKKRIAREQQLAREKAEADAEAKRLVQLKKEREEEERKAREYADEKRRKREAELALQKKAEEERAEKLDREKDRQEALQKTLAEEKKKQQDYERRLTREKKRRVKKAEKLETEREDNAKKGGQYLNPRYIPTEADKEEEARKQAELRERAKKQIANDYTIALTAEERSLSTNFEANRGRLPWPVASGFISDHFGRNKHPVFTKIETENYGIDILTKKGSPAYAIFAGEVLSVIYFAGAGQTVIVNHGAYYTVYSKLSNVGVRKGQKIALKQVLGNVMTDETGASKVHFELWSIGANGAAKKENPETWVRGQ